MAALIDSEPPSPFLPRRMSHFDQRSHADSEPPSPLPRRLSKNGQRAMTSAIAHSVKFQKLIHSRMEKLEEQLMESFTTALSELVPMQDDDCGEMREPRTSIMSNDSQVPDVCQEIPAGFQGSPILRPHATQSKPRTFREPPPVTGCLDDAASGLSAGVHGASRPEAGTFVRSGSSISDRSKPSGGQRLPAVAGWILDRQRTQGAWSESVWRCIEDPESSSFAYMYDRLNIPLICITVIIPLLQWVEGFPLRDMAATAVEIAIDTLFFLEAMVRFIVIPNRKEFFFDPYNFIDIISGLVLVVRILGEFDVLDDPEWVHIVLFCYVPVLRLLKVLRRYRQFHLLLQAFKLAFEALPVLLFCYAVSLLTFAALIYTFERKDGNIASLSQAMWLSVVTMTTVGYGDAVPKTPAGKAVTGLLTLVNSLYMAVPLGIIGNCFHQVWSNRDRLLLMQTLKVRLRQWGYSASDIPKLFEDFDLDGDGLLDFEEFDRMVQMLRLGLSADRTVQLFNVFDEDHGGNIDDKEFVRTTFPTAFHQIYNKSEEAQQVKMTIVSSVRQMMRSSASRLVDTLQETMFMSGEDAEARGGSRMGSTNSAASTDSRRLGLRMFRRAGPSAEAEVRSNDFVVADGDGTPRREGPSRSIVQDGSLPDDDDSSDGGPEEILTPSRIVSSRI